MFVCGCCQQHKCVGLARTIYICTVYFGIFGLEITTYTVYIYVHIQFWPTLQCAACLRTFAGRKFEIGF